MNPLPCGRPGVHPRYSNSCLVIRPSSSAQYLPHSSVVIAAMFLSQPTFATPPHRSHRNDQLKSITGRSRSA